MSEAKKFEQKTITIGEKEYVLQKLPTRKALEMKQRYMPNNIFDELKCYDEILEHIVVNPKVTIDDFEDISELDELGTKVLEFQFGGKYTKNN